MLAPFHSVLLHYPIGFITLAFLLEVWSLRNRSGELRSVITFVMALGALTAVLSAALGLLRAGGGEYESSSLNEHKWYGIGVTVSSLVAFVLLMLHRARPLRRWLLTVYRSVLMGSLVLLVVTGHLGGNLTHGSNYLLEGAPTFIKAMLMQETYGQAEAVPADELQRYFVDQVRPIFEAKCYSCHGAEKQRGDYRLDDPEIALKGGESGETAIKPGDPLGSHLVRLILLTSDDDDVMPPSGKLPLSPEETGRVIQWIKNGAVFPVGTNRVSAANEPFSAP
ncbi:MAG: hypothetical protein HC814_04675 [Rhodobacteraceae bacterium]|nr:hypothetical protein [Paracoccaceae bacterium]